LCIIKVEARRSASSLGCSQWDLPSSVINLSEEISIIIFGSISVLSQPKTQDEVMSNEENGKHADIVNSEPLVGSLGGESGGGGEDGGDGSGGDGGEGFEGLGLGGGTEGGLDDGACND
jgi:hypothetical protein